MLAVGVHDGDDVAAGVERGKTSGGERGALPEIDDMPDRQHPVAPCDLGRVVGGAVVDDDHQPLRNAIDPLGHTAEDRGNSLGLVARRNHDPQSRNATRRGVTG